MDMRSGSRWLAAVRLPALVALCCYFVASSDAQGMNIAGLQLAGAQVASSASQPQAPIAVPPPVRSQRPSNSSDDQRQSMAAAQDGTGQQPTPQPPAPSPAPQTSSPDGDALKLLQQGSRNIKQLQSQGLRGWADGTDPCQGWTGITCNRQNRVTKLELAGWGLETRLPPELSGLSKLEILNLTGNNLLGGLPSNWGNSAVFRNLTLLDLSNNPNLSGALPPNWGTQGAFPRLGVLSLGSTGVSGQLPLAWGGNLSLPSLNSLDLSGNLLDGSLPAGWGTEGAFSELRNLRLANNSLTGSLPAQWGSSSYGSVFPALSSLDLTNNSLSGYLPSGWGTGFQVMADLSLGNNSLTGELPAQWAVDSRWENLTKLDVHSNALTGRIPDTWSDWSILQQLSLILLPGNDFCGVLSSELQQSIQTANGSSIAANSFQACESDLAPSPSPAFAEQHEPAPSQPAPAPLPMPPAFPMPMPAPSAVPVRAPEMAFPPSPVPAPAPQEDFIPVPQPVAPKPDAAQNQPAPIPAPRAGLKAPVVAPKAPAPVPVPAKQPPANNRKPVPAPAPTRAAKPSGAAQTPAPAPGLEELAQVLARYNLTGPNLASNNETVQQMVLTAMNNTLSGQQTSGVQLQSFQSLPASGRRLLATSDDAQAIFLINTTMGTAPSVVQNLNSSGTTARFGQQLNDAGLPSVQPALQEARITNPLISNPLAPTQSAAAPPPAVPVGPSPQAGGTSLGGGAIGGIVVGVVAALVIAAVLVFCWRRRKAAAADTEKGLESDVETPKKEPGPRTLPAWLSFWPLGRRSTDSSKKGVKLDERATRAALKNRRPKNSLAEVLRAEDNGASALDSRQFTTTHSSLADLESYEEEEEERHTFSGILGLPRDSPRFGKPLSPSHRLDSAQSLKNAAAANRKMSPPGTRTPSSEAVRSEASPVSDHTAMISEAVATDQGLSGQSENLSGFTSGSSSEGRRKIPAASPTRTAHESMQKIDEKRDVSSRDGPLQAGPSNSGPLSGSKDLPTVGGRSRSAALLRALERELRQGQAPPSSYSRRHTAGEASIRQPKPESEKREVHWTESGGQRRPQSDAVRRNLEALEALERKHGGGAGADTAKLRAEVEEILGQNGYLKRSADEKAPPPSYHRRLAEETNPGRATSSRAASGSLSRNASTTLTSRQGSSALTSRPSGSLDALHRLGSGQGELKRQIPSRERHARAVSGPPGRSLESTPRGELRKMGSGHVSGHASGEPRGADRRAMSRNTSNERLGRLGSGGEGRAEDRLLRKQQTSQREEMLRDLERQLGLEPAPPPRSETRRETARELRSDQRREIAQRARKLLEDLGGKESLEGRPSSSSRQVERSGSRKPRHREEGGKQFQRS